MYFQVRAGRLANTSPDRACSMGMPSATSVPSYRPPMPRYVGNPESTDMPAPVSTSTRCAADNTRATVATCCCTAPVEANSCLFVTITMQASDLEHGFTVVNQLGHGVANIVHGQMRGVFCHAVGNVRRPAPGQLLERAHIDVPIVEISLQLRHVVIQKTAILTNAVAAHGRCAIGHILAQERQRLLLGFGFAHAGVAHAFDEA